MIKYSDWVVGRTVELLRMSQNGQRERDRLRGSWFNLAKKVSLAIEICLAHTHSRFTSTMASSSRPPLAPQQTRMRNVASSGCDKSTHINTAKTNGIRNNLYSAVLHGLCPVPSTLLLPGQAGGDAHSMTDYWVHVGISGVVKRTESLLLAGPQEQEQEAGRHNKLLFRTI